MRRQTVMLIGGLLLGLLGAGLTFTYVRGVEARADSKSEMVNAFVATEAIPAGTPGSLIVEVTERREVPRAYAQPGALQALDGVATQFTLRRIEPGQTLTGADFGALGSSAGRLPIPKGHEAVAIATTLDGGLGQYAQPGDRVSVYGTFRQPEQTTRKLLSNVLVIATQANPEAGDRLTGQAPGATGQVLFLLAVTPNQAGKIVFGQRLGEISLTLIPEGQSSPNPAAPSGDDDTAGLSASLHAEGI